MKRKRKASDAGPERHQDTEPFKPGQEQEPRKGSAGPDDVAPPEHRQSQERSEDFSRRRDIETADEPAEEHDRRHHDQDAEVGRPV